MKDDTILGVDLGWASQLESIGFQWVDEAGKCTDAIKGAKEMGANTVRLRVFVDPPVYGFWVKPKTEFHEHIMKGGLVMLGFCDKDSVVEMAKRVKEQDMKLMIDFHYSDHFADPMFQDTPKAWEEDDFEGLKKKLAEHTRDVMTALKEAGITPEYVQVGNEVNSGILLPVGSRTEHPKEMVELLNTGYDAVKEISPKTCVITHVSMGHMWNVVQDFFDVFNKYQGKTDMIGLSYYPAWVMERHNPAEFLITLNQIVATYEKPIVLSEIGGYDYEEKETYELLADTLELVNKVNGGALKGMVYWEPETVSSIMPDGYPLGAAKLVGEKKLQYTNALSAYRDYQKGEVR